jgi:hypothetical protein
MSSFHISSFAAHAAKFKVDRLGYIHTSIMDARGGDWGWGRRPTDAEAKEIANHNKAALKELGISTRK